jgi:hypothetical protein
MSFLMYDQYIVNEIDLIIETCYTPKAPVHNWKREGF